MLSQGEKFRGDLARLVCDPPSEVVVDEFTSVFDRQIARIGAMAFGKAWRRGSGRVVLLSCHYDVAEWLQPDWVFDTATGAFTGRYLQPRPRFELEIRQTGWEWWPRFEPHHYLKMPKMFASTKYVGFDKGEPVALVAVSTRQGLIEARFVYIHPYMDGNGRKGMFLMNVMLASGGYPWTIVPVSRRDDNMAALEQASTVRTSADLRGSWGRLSARGSRASYLLSSKKANLLES